MAAGKGPAASMTAVVAATPAKPAAKALRPRPASHNGSGVSSSRKTPLIVSERPQT